MPETTSQPAVETLEEIAERIADEYGDSIVYGELQRAILSALRNERDRAISIIGVVCEEYRVAHYARLAIINSIETWKVGDYETQISSE